MLPCRSDYIITMSLEIGYRLLKSPCVVLETPETRVTVVTQQSSDCSCFMVVIDMERIPPIARRIAATDGTDTTLTRKHLLVLTLTKSVLVLKMPYSFLLGSASLALTAWGFVSHTFVV